MHGYLKGELLLLVISRANLKKTCNSNCQAFCFFIIGLYTHSFDCLPVYLYVSLLSVCLPDGVSLCTCLCAYLYVWVFAHVFIQLLDCLSVDFCVCRSTRCRLQFKSCIKPNCNEQFYIKATQMEVSLLRLRMRLSNSSVSSSKNCFLLFFLHFV